MCRLKVSGCLLAIAFFPICYFCCLMLLSNVVRHQPRSRPFRPGDPGFAQVLTLELFRMMSSLPELTNRASVFGPMPQHDNRICTELLDKCCKCHTASGAVSERWWRLNNRSPYTLLGNNRNRLERRMCCLRLFLARLASSAVDLNKASRSAIEQLERRITTK
jgi:hypothetical protein